MDNTKDTDIKPKDPFVLKMENDAQAVMMMINGISREFESRMRSGCERKGIKSSYRQIIFHLAREDGLSQLELVRRIRFKPPTISVTVQSMESEGYVLRKPDPDDSRIIRVYLTDKGRQTDKQIFRTIQRTEKEFTAAIPEEDLRELRGYLEKIIDNIRGEGNAR